MRGHLFVLVVLVSGCTATVAGDPFDSNGPGDALGSQPGDDDAPASGDGTPEEPAAGDGDGLPGPPHADADNPVPGAFWDNVTNNLAAITDSECGNAASVFSNPWRDMLVTGVARHGLYASTTGGDSWVPLGTGGGDAIRNRMAVILFDPAHADTWWESGIYGFESPFSAGVSITTNNGDTFHGLTNMGAQNQSHNDSVSVDFTDPDRRTILSGGHEQGVTGSPPHGLFLSTDGGAHFDDIMEKLPAGLGFCTATLVVDADVLLVGCANSWAGNTPAIVQSTDGGATWAIVSQAGGAGQPLLTPDGTIYWSSNGSMLKSTNRGASFAKVNKDGEKTGELPPLELPDGRIASVGDRKVVVSDDGGVTWHAVTDAIPFLPNGLTYSPFRRAFFASHFDCTNAMPSDAHARYGWDYETR